MLPKILMQLCDGSSNSVIAQRNALLSRPQALVSMINEEIISFFCFSFFLETFRFVKKEKRKRDSLLLATLHDTKLLKIIFHTYYV